MREQPADKAINSTALRNEFKLPYRATARRIMRSLAEAGKVQIVEHGDASSKRKPYSYKVVA